MSPKIRSMKVSPNTILNNTSLPKETLMSIDVLESIAEPPDIPWRHLFEPGAGFEGGI